ncbi:MAG TPA: hypothetical protein VMJ35_09610 [Dongiaceae bacterium]|nr:hypothetical protein [Dongiaceae bacterium]
MSAMNATKKIGADEIRDYSSRTFVAPARQKAQKRFSIKVGDVVRELKLYRSIPAVCSALKTREFQRTNGLKLVDATGPKSGLSTTVVFTYEFLDPEPDAARGGSDDPWSRLRGALKDVFAELGGGEAYLRAERRNFYAPED